MSSVNKVTLLGNLGEDPDTRYMPNGDAVCNIRLATSESWKDKTSGERKEATEWHRIVIYRKLAEVAGQYLKKGSKAYFEGKLVTRKWQDKDGQERYTTEIVAHDLVMLDSRPADSKPRDSQGSESASNKNSQGATRVDQDFIDDIPF